MKKELLEQENRLAPIPRVPAEDPSDFLESPGPKVSKSRRLKILHGLGFFLIFAFYAAILVSPLLKRVDSIFLDYFFNLRGPAAVHPDIVYIEIGEDTF